MLTLNVFMIKNTNDLCRTDNTTEAEFVQHTTAFFWKERRESSASIKDWNLIAVWENV